VEHFLERRDDRHGGRERILAPGSRRRPGMGVLALDLDQEAAGALNAGDDADRVALDLELGPCSI